MVRPQRPLKGLGHCTVSGNVQRRVTETYLEGFFPESLTASHLGWLLRCTESKPNPKPKPKSLRHRKLRIDVYLIRKKIKPRLQPGSGKLGLYTPNIVHISPPLFVPRGSQKPIRSNAAPTMTAQQILEYYDMNGFTQACAGNTTVPRDLMPAGVSGSCCWMSQAQSRLSVFVSGGLGGIAFDPLFSVLSQTDDCIALNC